MRKPLLLTFLIIQVLISLVSAQSNYPLFVTPTLTPPYSLNLSDYNRFGSQKLMVTVHANDLEINNLPIKLRIKMETVGVTIENPPTITTTPIYISGGETSVLFGNDLESYFNINNLIFKGYSKETYKRTGQLPEGFYRFTVEILHFNSNRVISNQGTITAWIALGKPPILKLPENNTQMGQYKGIPLTFSWMSSNVGSPVSSNTIQYKFEMWEMHVPGINPNVVAASTPVFHEYSTFSNVYTLYPNSLLMTPGMQYAWRVTASDLSGFVPFEQKGQSEIRTFIYKAACDSVTNLSGINKGRNGLFSWEPESNHTSFNVEVRNPITNWAKNSESFENKAEFYDLAQGSTYEMRVQAVCDGDPDSKSDFSGWKSIKIPVPAPPDTTECPDCECDDQIPDIELENFELREDLSPGDTIISKTGTSRYILKTVEPQGNGVYKGLFFFWAEIWNLKVICKYWDLQVNTDNVIVNMDYESVYDPQFLVDVDEVVNYLDSLGSIITTLTSDTTIGDTLTISSPITTVYVNEGDSVIVVTVDENGNTNEVVISDDVNDIEETLIVGENGEEYVVNKDGELMGVDEYKNSGGGKNTLVDDYNKEKEENKLSDDITIEFSAKENQKYGFDKFNDEKSALQAQYPSLNNGYQPAYKSVASFNTDIVGSSNVGNNIIFKDEMGIPAVKTGDDITIRGAVGGSEVALYAYQQVNDTTQKIAGKLNIKSYDEQTKKLYIVPVNGAATPDKASLQGVLNKIYSQAITKWEVEKLDNLEGVIFENGNMTHGGSSAITVYNKDQKTIVNNFKNTRDDGIESNAYYLFFVENVQFKESSIAGYMPLQRQIGFIYENPSMDIVAHELGHGAFNLHHTFSTHNFIATEHSTQNLMDYKGGTELWKHQWDLIHDPEGMLFAWAQDEEEGESAIVSNMEEIYSKFKNPDGSLTFLTPSGKPLTIKEKINWIKFVTLDQDDKWEKDKSFLPMGTLSEFGLVDGRKFQATSIVGSKTFNGYMNLITDKYYEESLSKNLNFSVSKVLVGILALEDKKPYFYVQATNYLEKYPNKKTVNEPNKAKGDEIGEYKIGNYLLNNPSPVRVYAKFAQDFSIEELFFLNHHTSLGMIKGKDAVYAFKAVYYIREIPNLLSCMQNMGNSLSGTLNSSYMYYKEQQIYNQIQVDNTDVYNELYIRDKNKQEQEEQEEFIAENYFEKLLSTLRYYYNRVNSAESVNPSDKIGDIMDYFGEIDDDSFCLLRLLDFESRKAILNRYSTWTFTTSKETLIQNAVASTPEDQYDDLFKYLSDTNYEKLWAIYSDLGGGNRDQFVAAVSLLNKLVNGKETTFNELKEIDPESLLDLEGDDETTKFIFVCQDGDCDIDEDGHYECTETEYDKKSNKIEFEFTIDDENWSLADKKYTYIGDPFSYIRVKFLDDYRFTLLGEEEKVKAGDDVIVPALWLYHILKEQNQVENMVVLRVVGNIVAVVISVATLEPGPLLLCEIIFAVGDISFAFADEAIANSDNQDLKDAVAVWDGLTLLVGAGAITKGVVNGITKIKINKSFFRSNWESIKATPDLLKKHLNQLTTFLRKAKNGLTQIKNGDLLYDFMLNIYLEGRIIQRSRNIDQSIVQLINNGNEYVIQAKNGNIANKVAEVVENADGDVVFSSIRWTDNTDAALVSAIDDVKYYDDAGNINNGDIEVVVNSAGQYFLRIPDTDILFSIDELMTLTRSELPTFVTNNLDNLLTSENKRIIWELTNEVPTGQFKRGDLIEEIFNQWGNKYGSYQNLNDIIPNYRTLDFDGVLANIDEVVSLKSFKPLSNNLLSNFKSKLRSYAKKLNDDIDIAQNHAGKERILDFVIEEGAWTSSQLDDIDDYIVELYDLFENVGEIRITEF